MEKVRAEAQKKKQKYAFECKRRVREAAEDERRRRRLLASRASASFRRALLVVSGARALSLDKDLF